MGYSTLLLVDQHCRRRVESPPLESLYCTGLHRPDALHASLATLSGRVDLALGDSEYNRRELEAL